jgi:uncharacterized membrane protein YcaP (DUF421 family)
LQSNRALFAICQRSNKAMVIFTILRAVFGYLFLVLMVRVVGRRPGKQLTPFEFVLVFYLGGLTLTGLVGTEVSLTNAVCQILTIAACHYVLSALRFRWDRLAKLLDGTPLVLLENNQWREENMKQMNLLDDDVMDAARDNGIRDLSGIRSAVLESFGEISIVPGKSGDEE